MFVLGIPLVLLSILGNVGYYSIAEFHGGLGELAYNGFLVLFFILLYFFIFPALVLTTRKVNF
jgi:hypothetical protein